MQGSGMPASGYESGSNVLVAIVVPDSDGRTERDRHILRDTALGHG
jgi:hypothetical protein